MPLITEVGRVHKVYRVPLYPALGQQRTSCLVSFLIRSQGFPAPFIDANYWPSQLSNLLWIVIVINLHGVTVIFSLRS